MFEFSENFTKKGCTYYTKIHIDFLCILAYNKLSLI